MILPVLLGSSAVWATFLYPIIECLWFDLGVHSDRRRVTPSHQGIAHYSSISSVTEFTGDNLHREPKS
ncbi:hypothetical protein FLL88_15760 [Vibrio cholerae]|nr:hypothetical protein B7937_10735 [Vibrio cholerae]TQP77631.1 hypothetical protein FLL88_15760 [Vibrio cholerae]